MKGQLSVNFLRLGETSVHIQQTIAALGSQLEQLEKDAAPLVQTWSGDAKEAYLQRQATWRQASTELTATLQSIKHGLDESLADFRHTERSAAARFS